MRLLVLAFTLAIVLAGCSSDGPPETAGDVIPTKDVKTGSDVGAISGVVIDDAITPLAGATVAIRSVNLTQTTDGEGNFVFENIAPGTYFLEASADQYLPIQQQVTVVAGEVAKPAIKLPGDLRPVPYHNTITFSGHMTASDIYVVYYLTYLTGNSTLCECIFTFQVDPGYKTAVLQGDWTPNVDPTGDHAFYWEIWGGEDEEGYNAGYLAPGEKMVSQGANFGASQGELWIQVSSSEVPDVEQPFDGYLTLFYVEGAPDGWSFDN